MRALIVGDSGGIGAAVAQVLRGQGVAVDGLSRRNGFDFLQPEAAEQRLAALKGPFDLIFVASGVLAATREGPEKALRDLSAAEMAAQFAVNTIGPALVLKAAPRLLPRNKRAVLAMLSARVGSIGDNRAGGWYSYRASKAALNQVVRSGAIELARSHRQAICVALHPGTVATRFTENYPAHKKQAPEAAAAALVEVMSTLTPAETGAFFDYAGAPVVW